MCACALPIHARAYTTHTNTCVCVVYVRVCIGGAHTHNVRVCALPIHARAYTTHTHTCVRGVYIGNERTHKVRVCALPIQTRAYTTHRHHVCVRGVYTCMYRYFTHAHNVRVYYFCRMSPKPSSTTPPGRLKARTIDRYQTPLVTISSVALKTLKASH